MGYEKVFWVREIMEYFVNKDIVDGWVNRKFLFFLYNQRET